PQAHPRIPGDEISRFRVRNARLFRETRMSQSQYALFGQRRFAPLFWTQFLGAANDSLFKFAFTLLATYHAAEWGGVAPATAGFLIGAIFIAPFVLFSATAGQLADR